MIFFGILFSAIFSQFLGVIGGLLAYFGLGLLFGLTGDAIGFIADS